MVSKSIIVYKRLFYCLFLVVFIGLKTGYAQGELWGMTSTGGINNLGVIFKTNGDGSNYTVIKEFTRDSPTPANPDQNHLIEVNGKLYGMSPSGGTYNQGVLFEYDPTTDIIINKVNFKDTMGISPKGSLVLSSNGKLYGMTNAGGALYLGVLFEYDINTNTYIKLFDFDGSTRGSYPRGSLIQAGNGNLFGMTSSGGANNSGVLFEYDVTTSTFIKRFDFDGTLNGSSPLGELSEASNKKLYGIANGGLNNMGVLFEYDPATTNYTKKIDFDGSTYGRYPSRSLLCLNDKLYGFTSGGGLSNNGLLFEYNVITNTYTKKLDLNVNSVDGYSPQGALVQSGNNKFYGITYGGGVYSKGVLFEYDLITNKYLKKIDFDGTINGGNPLGQLFQASNGKLYGMTNNGGINNEGTLYEYNPATSILNVKMVFSGILSGGMPYGSLVRASNGKLYGMTSIGGTKKSGTLFELDPVTYTYSKKFDFDGSANGGNPYGTLMEFVNGKLYGMTTNSGALSSCGVIFEYDPSTSVFLKKIDFDWPIGCGALGYLQAQNGKLYGMSTQGGINNKGVIFEYEPITNTITKKFDFDGINGSNPWFNSFTQAVNGKLYGMTLGGGKNSLGVLFEYDPVSAVFTKKFDFDGSIYGGTPANSLTLASNEKLYGCTRFGGVNNKGVLFEYDPITSTLTKKFDFDGVYNGGNPDGNMTLAPNGKLYGLTTGGGIHNKGVLFEYDPVTNNYSKKFDFSGMANGKNPYATTLLFMKSNQKITFDPIAIKTYGDAPFALIATVPSGLPVTFSSLSDKISINGNQVNLLKPGQLSIKADQVGDSYNNAAPSIVHTFCINPPKPSFSINNINPDSPILTSGSVTGNQWYVNGNAITGATQQDFTLVSSGNYTLRVGIDNCFSEESIPYNFIVTSTNPIIENNVSGYILFPNPVYKEMYVNLGDYVVGKPIQMEIFSMTGQKKKVWISEGGKIEVIDMEEYSSGVYILKIDQDDSSVLIKIFKK